MRAEILKLQDKIEYISVDPGETTGIVYWDATPQMMFWEQLKIDDLKNLWDDLDTYGPPKVIIIEKYIGYAGYSHTGDTFKTSQVIGRFKFYAERLDIPVVEQMAAQVLKVAQMWSGVSMKGPHSKSHWKAAYNHGYYYLHKQGLIRARVLGK